MPGLGRASGAQTAAETPLESPGRSNAETPALSLRLTRSGAIVECSRLLYRRLGTSADINGRLLVDLVRNAPDWLRQVPGCWPQELAPLEFISTESSRLILGGMLLPQAEGWLLVFVDLSPWLLRQQDLAAKQALLQQGARMAARLRGRAGGSELLIGDWLEDLALRLKLPWFVLLLREGATWHWCQSYPADTVAGMPTPAELTGLVARADCVPQQLRTGLDEAVWLVPYLEATEAGAWLCCAGVAQRDVPWLSDEDWCHLLAQVAEPLLRRQRDHDLRQRQERYDALEHMSTGGWWEYRPATRSLTLSPALTQQLRLAQPASEGLTLEQWLHGLAPVDREEFAVKLQAAVAQQQRFVHTARLRLGTDELWYSFEGELVGTQDQQRLLGFAFDVNRTRQREQEADAAKARLAGLVDSAPGVIYVQGYSDGALELVFCSASLTTLLGWGLADFQARPYVSFVHPEDQERYLERNRQLLSQGRASTQYRIRRRDGEVRWVQDEARLLRDERGMPVEAVGLYLDVTEAREAAERVFRSEESYRLLVDHSPAIICRYSATLQVIFANPTLASALDVDGDQLQDLNLSDFLSPEQHQQALARLASLSPANPFASSELCIRRKDMTERWWVIYERGLFDEQGHLLEVQAVGRDNTEVHQTRKQLFHSAKMATLGEMATGLAHEINQPLSVIQLSLTNLQARINNATVTPPYLLEKLERIASQVQRAAGIVNHVCIFGRWSGVEGVSFSLATSIDGALSLVGPKLQLQDIEVSLEGIAELPAITGQPDRFEQVLINLLMNASYALREQQQRVAQLKPHIKISGVVVDSVVRLSVSDNGGGIPPPILERIFDPFFTTKPVDHGTGLGLSVSRAIISQMSGTLRVENTAHGACFLLELPLPAAAAQAHE